MMLDSAMVKWQKLAWNLDRESTHSTDSCAQAQARRSIFAGLDGSRQKLAIARAACLSSAKLGLSAVCELVTLS